MIVFHNLLYLCMHMLQYTIIRYRANPLCPNATFRGSICSTCMCVCVCTVFQLVQALRYESSELTECYSADEEGEEEVGKEERDEREEKGQGRKDLSPDATYSEG